MATHTPGPWAIKTARANEANGSPIHCEIQGGNYVVVRLGSLHGETNRANARLIAAAPDLLAALQGWIAFCDKLEGKPATMTSAAYMDVLRDIARAAIAKAEGA